MLIYPFELDKKKPDTLLRRVYHLYLMSKL